MSKKLNLLRWCILLVFAIALLPIDTAFAYFYQLEREYRGGTSGSVSCLSGGLIGLRLTPENGQTSSARLKVEVVKCQGGNFVSGGYYYIRMDGTRITGKITAYAGIPSQTTYVSPDIYGKDSYGNHTYQVELYSSNDPSQTAKWTGKTQAQTWGRCWCNEYIRQKFGFSENDDGYRFGPILQAHGYRLLDTSIDPVTKKPKETPQVGDIAVVQSAFPNNSTKKPFPSGHVAIVSKFDPNTWKFSLRQGGSAGKTDYLNNNYVSKWMEESYCYNVHNMDIGASAFGQPDIKFYRK